ncbi:MAG: hypothetical protein GY838_15225 [bacterium]|nr:hypothetical protein [bacterium]
MPLDVGNTWHYAFRMNEPGAPIIPTSRTILEHRTIPAGDGAVTVALEVEVPDGTRKAIWPVGRLLRNEADGLYLYGTVEGESTNLLEVPRRLAPSKGSVGESYDWGGGALLVCIAADSQVTTDFGEVRADVYYLSLEGDTIRVPDIYVVPGVGMSLFSYTSQSMTWLVGYDFD